MIPAFPWNWIPISRAAATSKYELVRKTASLFISVAYPGICGEFWTPCGWRTDLEKIEKGFLYLNALSGDTELEIDFAMSPHFVRADPRVRADIGKIAIVRGPEVYCLEGCDDGSFLADVFVDSSACIEEVWCGDLLGGTITLKLEGERINESEQIQSTSFMAFLMARGAARNREKWLYGLKKCTYLSREWARG